MVPQIKTLCALLSEGKSPQPRALQPFRSHISPFHHNRQLSEFMVGPNMTSSSLWHKVCAVIFTDMVVNKDENHFPSLLFMNVNLLHHRLHKKIKGNSQGNIVNSKKQSRLEQNNVELVWGKKSSLFFYKALGFLREGPLLFSYKNKSTVFFKSLIQLSPGFQQLYTDYTDQWMNYFLHMLCIQKVTD